MKKLKTLASFLSALALALILSACGGDSNTPDVEPGTLGSTEPALIAASQIAKEIDPNNENVILFYYREDASYSKWGLWLWDSASAGGEASYNVTKGKAVSKSTNGCNVAYWNISNLTKSVSAINSVITDSQDLGLIIRDDDWNKDPGPDQTIPLSEGSKHFVVLSGDTGVYTVADSYNPKIAQATSISAKKILVSLSVTYGLNVDPSSSGFIVEDENGNTISVIDSVNYENQDNRRKNNAKNVLLTLDHEFTSGTNYYLKHDSFLPKEGVLISMRGAVKEATAYDGTDLGLTLDGNKATFKTWAPVASDVKLLVYSSGNDIGSFTADAVKAKKVGSLDNVELLGTPAQTFQMVKDASTNVWSYTIEDVSSYKYYKYQIVNSGTTTYVSDIWGKSCSADSVASQIVDINSASEAIPTGLSYGTKEAYKNPFNGDGTKAVIYEMHITDWSYAEDNSTGNVGKYLTIANGTKVINHLKDLGVTHVQLLPVFDFAETNANTSYNWGYNPYHYNVPEGRYVTEGYTDGTQAVLELRTLISILHEAGISVIMDVVYNHTNGTKGGSLYDSTVPYYFYRFDSEGNYSNGSGCGNEFDSEATMAKKYIIESLKHWMLDYHFNGFRFDLMGCLSKETMADIYKELSAIDSSVLIYGEPWTGGTAAVVNGAVQAVSVDSYGVGAFDDDYRDAIKGAEFGGFKQGHVQKANSDSAICLGLMGKSGINNRNTTDKLSLRINYAECHDNYTLFDKLAISYLNKTKGSGNLFTQIKEEGLDTVKKWDTLAAAYVYLGQGMAFMNGGQEFLRTKKGNENSYKSTYTINGIDLTFKDTYSDVYNTYKGLIALRKANPSAFGSNSSANATTVSTGITKYTTGDFVVYFNATNNSYTIPTDDTTSFKNLIEVSSGSVVSETVDSEDFSVNGKSFKIFSTAE